MGKSLQNLTAFVAKPLTCPLLCSANAALLAGIFSILALIILAFVLAAWWHYRKRKARKIAAAGQMEERKDAPTIVRYVGENLSAERVR
jgi:cbb3-type cytochrome oxidase subunit 3